MVWLQFFLSTAIIVVTAIKLAQYAEIISVRTRLGGLFVGTLLLAGATSLPELFSTLAALGQRLPNLAAGNLFGSNMLNMFLLALLDVLAGNQRVLRRVAARHALTAGLAILLTLIAAISILSGVTVRVGWFGVESLVIMVAYVGGLRLIQGTHANPYPEAAEEPEAEQGGPSLLHGVVGFGVTGGILLVVTPWLVRTSIQIAEITGLSAGFVGTTLVALATSLPELVTCVAALRLGAYDLAVGDLFGSNLFNMFMIGLADVLYLPGTFLSTVSPSFALGSLLAAILTTLALIGSLARIERRLILVEIDALLIAVAYFLGLWFLYMQGQAI